MSYADFSVPFGGISYYASVLKAMISPGTGWTVAKFAYDRPDWGSVPVVQRNTRAIEIDVTGLPLPVTLPLPVMFIQNQVEERDFGFALTQGVDVNTDGNFGQVEILPGGIFDNGAGFGQGSYTIQAGYEIKQGWAIVESSGISGSETILLGMRFNSAVDNPDAPQMTGIEWSTWISVPADTTSYETTTVGRSQITDDVRNYVAPNGDVTGGYSLTEDRIIVHGRANCFTSWCCAGAMARLRTRTEQRFITGMLGSTSRLEDSSGGPVGKTDEPGEVLSGQEMGTVYLFDQAGFVRTQSGVELNANHWGNEVGHPTNGYTPSTREVVPGSGSVPGTDYLELHTVITARDVTQVGALTNIIYGVWEGLHTVLAAEPSHNLQVTMDGRTFRLWQVGSSRTRYIAVEEL